MGLVQVVPQQLHFGGPEGWHVVHVHAAHLKLYARGQIALVEFPITRRVPRALLGGHGVVHRVVGPDAVHIGVVGIGGPGTASVLVPIRRDVAGIGYRHVPDDVKGLHIARITVVVPLDDALDAGDRSCTGNVAADDAPSVGSQIARQDGQFRTKRRGKCVVHQQDHLAPIVHHGYLYPGVDVARACDPCRHAHDLVFVVRTKAHTGIRPRSGCCRWRGYCRPPSGGGFRLSVDRDRGGTADRRPGKGDGRRILDRGCNTHCCSFRRGLGNKCGRGKQGDRKCQGAEHALEFRSEGA